MGDIGLELPTFPAGKIEIARIGGAESGARMADPAPAPGSPREPDTALALVMRRWPTLTAEQRLAILEIATTSAAPEAGELRVASC